MTSKTVKVAAGGPQRKVPRYYQTHDPKVMVKQEFADECNIKNILENYTISKKITHINPLEPQYGFATGNDFRESLEIVQIARDNFMKLPSALRRDFDNDPANFLNFASDPANASEMASMGLIDPIDVPGSKTAPPPQDVPVSEPVSDPETKPAE